MTTPEHTLVGIHLALACRLHSRYGWPLLVGAGVASNLPDWDGLPMLLDMQRYESGHRVWGHNVFSILIGSAVLAWTQCRWRWIERCSASVARWLPSARIKTERVASEGAEATPPQVAKFVNGPGQWQIWFVMALIAQLVHLPCDMVVSGGQGLTDWPIQPFWPISTTSWVYPLIPWGDVGPTVFLMLGCIIAAQQPRRTTLVSSCTLAGLIIYLAARGNVW
ncbi:MAG: metal-dependent hydrolase [Planctomycetaceae bacterium]|nr:metal-dependent hydrolase [Planctomycetaceae bacterium]